MFRVMSESVDRPRTSNYAIGSVVAAVCMFPNILVVTLLSLLADSVTTQQFGGRSLFTKAAMDERGLGFWLMILLLVWPGIFGIWAGFNGLDDVKYNGRKGKWVSIVGIALNLAIGWYLIVEIAMYQS